MPRGDGAGPAGHGQMTGRQLGYCAGYDEPGYVQSGFYGCGRGRGRAQGGRGMLFRRGAGGVGGMPGFVAGDSAVSPATEAAQLKSRIDRMERTLQIIKQRLEGLGGEGGD